MRLFRKRKPEQTCWVYCPSCERDLCTEPGTESTDTDLVRYVCGNCGTRSTWDFDLAPVPILLPPEYTDPEPVPSCYGRGCSALAGDVNGHHDGCRNRPPAAAPENAEPLEPDGFCDRCGQKVWTRGDGTLMGHPCRPENADAGKGWGEQEWGDWTPPENTDPIHAADEPPCRAADCPCPQENTEPHTHATCPDGPDSHEDYCLNGRQE